MILQDDNFATIIHAVEQGRKLYDNLTKYVRFILITLVAFVLTFLAASVLNIAAGQPFTPLQILWINFLIDTPLGISLGFDAESPGIMLKKPRLRNATILTRGVITTAAGVGIFMAAWLIALINHGLGQPGGAAEGAALALTAFAYFRIVCTYESRSETGSVLHVSSFDNRTLNIIVLVEVALAYLVTSMDAFQKLLGTTDLSDLEWAVAFGAAVSLLAVWEIGKALVRRTERSKPA
jgi:Ca2+-transporting ATPase